MLLRKHNMDSIIYRAGNANQGRYRKFLDSTLKIIKKDGEISLYLKNEEQGHDVYSDLKKTGLSDLEFKHLYIKYPIFSHGEELEYNDKYSCTIIYLK